MLRRMLTMIHFQRAAKFYSMGKWEACADALTKSISLARGETALPGVLLFILLMQTGKRQEAMKLFKKLDREIGERSTMTPETRNYARYTLLRHMTSEMLSYIASSDVADPMKVGAVNRVATPYRNHFPYSPPGPELAALLARPT